MMQVVTYHEGKKYVTVSKKTAEKIYNAGYDVTLCPEKMLPFTGWNMGCTISKTDTDTDSFTERLQNFSSYNCQLWETGYYARYYVRASAVKIVAPQALKVAEF